MSNFVIEYLIFSLLCNFGVIVISIAKNKKSRLNFLRRTKLNPFWGYLLIGISYVWFFSSENRSVQTSVEGAQLFFIFGFSTVVSLYGALFLAKRVA